MKILGLTISSTIRAFLNHSVSQSIRSLLLKLIINFGGKSKSVSSPKIVCNLLHKSVIYCLRQIVFLFCNKLNIT